MTDVIDTGVNPSYFVDFNISVSRPSPSTEKAHGVLFVKNKNFNTNILYKEFTNSADVVLFFPNDSEIQDLANKYFSVQDKLGNAPEKLLIANWYQTAQAGYMESVELSKALSTYKVSGTFNITLNDVEEEINYDFTSATGLSDIASSLQTLIRASNVASQFADCTVVYDSTTKKIVITNGTTGSNSTISINVPAGDDFAIFGFNNDKASQGVNAESLQDCFNRVYETAYSGFSYFYPAIYTDLSTETLHDIYGWFQDKKQYIRLVVNITELASALTEAEYIQGNSLTAIKVVYDEFEGNLGIYDCGLAGAFDPSTAQMDFDKQLVAGFGSSTHYGSIVDRQAGKDNEVLMNQLNSKNIGYVYTYGVGVNATNYYSDGTMSGMWTYEALQVQARYICKELQNQYTELMHKSNNLGAKDPTVLAQIISIYNLLFSRQAEIGNIVVKDLSASEQNLIRQKFGDEGLANVMMNGWHCAIQKIEYVDGKYQMTISWCECYNSPLKKIQINGVVLS